MKYRNAIANSFFLFLQFLIDKTFMWSHYNTIMRKKYMGISLFILLLCIFPINAQTPHTLYGYIFYSADTPANNFSIIVINHDRNETITEESKYIYKNQNYYQIEVGSPGL